MLVLMRMRFGGLNPRLLNKAIELRNAKTSVNHQKKARKRVFGDIKRCSKTGNKYAYIENYWLTDKVKEELLAAGFNIPEHQSLMHTTLIKW